MTARATSFGSASGLGIIRPPSVAINILPSSFSSALNLPFSKAALTPTTFLLFSVGAGAGAGAGAEAGAGAGAGAGVGVGASVKQD